MTRSCLLSVLFACAALVGCDKSKSKATPAALSASATAAETPKAETPPPPAPADLDVASLRKDLACDGKRPRNTKACEVMDAFAKASRWTAKTPSGLARYVGRSYILEKGHEEQEITVLYSKIVPTAQVPAGYMPVLVGKTPLPKELHLNGVKLIASLAHNSAPSRRNQAMPWVDQFEPTKTYEVATTSGPSVHLVATESVYIREVDRRKIVVVSPANALGAAPGDGTYSELWIASW